MARLPNIKLKTRLRKKVIDGRSALALYRSHLIGGPFRRLIARVKLWHWEITKGPHIADFEPALVASDDLTVWETEKWQRRAWRYSVPLPDRESSDHWYTLYLRRKAHGEAGGDQALILTRKGLGQIRTAIREEKRERSERVIKWATLAFAATAAFASLFKLLFTEA